MTDAKFFVPMGNGIVSPFYAAKRSNKEEWSTGNGRLVPGAPAPQCTVGWIPASTIVLRAWLAFSGAPEHRDGPLVIKAAIVVPCVSLFLHSV